MTRDEKIKFLIEAAREFEGVILTDGDYMSYTDEQIDEEVEWYEYLLDK